MTDTHAEPTMLDVLPLIEAALQERVIAAMLPYFETGNIEGAATAAIATMLRVGYVKP